MKRGKGEEKVMGPMFPRLHVNDTDKGGPRAPPRNKMALYEQLSIPSQRFNSGVLPLDPNNTSKMAPPSSSQGSGHDRSGYLPIQHPPSRRLADKPPGHSSDPSTLLQQYELKKRTEEDDFTVPIFVNSKLGQAHGSHNVNMEKLSPSGQLFCPNKELEGVTHLTLRQQRNSQNKENLKCTLARREKTTSNSASKECRLDPQVGCSSIPEPVKGTYDGSSYPRKEFVSEEQLTANDLVNDTESQEDRAHKSLQTGNLDRGDDLSETSRVESISGTDISPDDIVGIIGLKRFWKARRAIVNQQRVFAIQVFELHRLIKVQRLIAGSPNSSLEDPAYLGKPLKSSSIKRLPLDCIVRESQSVLKRKHDSEKPHFRMEHTAESNVGKASLSTVQNGSQLSSHKPFSGTPLPTPVTNDSNAGPWCFQQPPGHQWLIPVMSPSEGLVYKPFPGPGFTSPICGSGPPGSSPTMGNFFAPTYGVPAPNPHYQGMGVPFAPPTGHGYFRQYGMPAMNPPISSTASEESNQYTMPGLQHQFSGVVDDVNIQHQDSSNVLNQKKENVPDVVRYQSTKDNEVQASSASSPIETAGRNMLSLFPTSPVTDNRDGSPQACVPDNPARVIKVVPHNARSATESVARIFQSIQQERNNMT
ncbi:protein EARLY FLOWERING 3 [Solanum lycopersicum]|uniref:protein EARLY FLOWERING 3 n=1 Tax=Solanum lycopersicum TaxID=4081 RepID=UPI000276B8A3|nr:protein EARLY FLOWERING 3 [Solanum lycopersicum]